MVLIQQVNGQREIEAVKQLIRDFTNWAVPLTAHIEHVPTFDNLEAELARLPGEYAPPQGRLLLAQSEGQAAGCIALKRHSPTLCELKRLYVKPEFRGRGIGWQLVDAVLSEARRSRYQRMILDSHISMTKAHDIYGVFGFRETAPPQGFPAELAKEVVFMECDL